MDVDEEQVDIDPIHDIIDFLVRVKDVNFKSQQKEETDLTTSEKKEIAFGVYTKGKLPFLKRFGKHLRLKHLIFFEPLKDSDNSNDNYEINFLLDELKVALSEQGRKFIVKNRRYEALSKMIKDTTYFSEVEMMQRNPLLYEHLVGQYMSENEKRARDNIDTENITLLNVLLEGISKTHTKTMLKDQKDKEDEEEADERCSSDREIESDEDAPAKNAKTKAWGEFNDCVEETKKKPKKRVETKENPHLITAPERDLLREEFVQEMYRSFVDGEDEEFDYQTVDCNSEYDCLQVKDRDAEERYFDTETPESDAEATATEEKISSDDELDVFMNHINRHPSVVNTVQI